MVGSPGFGRPGRPVRRTLALAVASLLAVGWAGVVAPHAAAAVNPSDRAKSIQHFNDLAAVEGAVGTYFDAATGEVVAVLPPGNAGSFDTAAASPLTYAASVGVPARVAKATIDKATIGEIEGALTSFRASLPTAYKYAFFFDPQRQVVIIQGDAPESAFASILSQFGAHVLYQRGTMSVDSRSADSPPHKGGASIIDAIGHSCTTGFTVVYQGTNYLTTAGHCFAQGAMTWNTYVGTNQMGAVYWRAGSTVDVELVYAEATGRIYTSSTATKPVAGAYDPVVGYTQYCMSGYTSGVICNEIDWSNSVHFCPYFCADNFAGFYGTMAQNGDSGAPWYLDGGSWVSIAASHSGHFCQQYSTCTNYASRWSVIASYFGVSIRLG